MKLFGLPCFVLKNRIFFVACVPSALCFLLTCGGAHMWCWPRRGSGSDLPFSVGLSSASSGPASEEAGWEVLGRNGKNFHAVLFLSAKEIYAFVICVVPEDSKGVITQRSARDEELGTFVLLLPGRAVVYLLEE